MKNTKSQEQFILQLYLSVKDQMKDSMYYLLSVNVVLCEYTFEHAYSISEMIHSDSLGQSTDRGDGEEKRRAMTH